MSNKIFEFKALHKTLGSIETDVIVYDDKVEMNRKVTGILATTVKLPTEKTVYFSDLETINYSDPTHISGKMEWIELVSNSHNSRVVRTVEAVGLGGDIVVSAMNDPCCVFFSKNNKEMRNCYEKLRSIFNNYCENTSNKNESFGESPLDKLKKLKELLDIGAINQEEFDKKKAEILSQI